MPDDDIPQSQTARTRKLTPRHLAACVVVIFAGVLAGIPVWLGFDRTGGDQNTTPIHTVAPIAPPAFLGASAPGASFSEDRDAAGIVASPTTALVTSEDGGTASFTVALASRPAAPVVLKVVSGNVAEAVVAPKRITFDETNWHTPVRVTVTGQADDEDDGDVAYVVLIGPASSADADYDGISAPALALVNRAHVDQPPVISGIANRTLTAPAQVAFTIADPDTPLDALALAAGSSSLSVVPLSGLSFAGAGKGRALLISPGQPGTSIVTIVVADGHSTTATSFFVTVQKPDVEAVEVLTLAPWVGATNGGTRVRLTGRNFSPGLIVSFDGEPATSVQVLNETTISAITPPHGPGAVALSLADAGGVSRALENAFVYGEGVPLQVAITSPTGSPAFEATSPLLAIAGSAASAAGLTRVSWRTDAGATGEATGLDAWTASGIPLHAGANVITVDATDAAGAAASDAISVNVSSFVYYLSEGATGFFDLSVVLANPTDEPAPTRMTFLRVDGSTIERECTVSPKSQLTVRVNDIPGLESAAVSTVVESMLAVPLVVERTMKWDAQAYAAHASSAVDGATTRWYFSEGSQGFFDTYLLLANPNAEDARARVRFFTEGGAVVTANYTLGPTSRTNVFAGSVPSLRGKSFSMVVDADLPIIAERAMYFGSARFWDGGHESAGVTAPATTWFHAEGATGSLFDNYILVGNSNFVPAHVEFTFLTGPGTTIVYPVTVPRETRLTVNVETVDPRLANAAVSTKVTSDVPVVSERSMYWPGVASEWLEAHNSFGATAPSLRWGLADGQAGGRGNARTYILLANPTTTPARVRVTYLRERNGPLVEEYDVAATSRYTIPTSVVPGLADRRFGALVESLDGVPLVVERAMYWSAPGVQWKGGTNVVATPLP